jgi:hypothetical protein
MIRKALLGIAASLMTFSAFSGTVLVMGGTGGSPAQVA